MSEAIDWHDWFESSIANRGGFFKFMYDSWTFSSPLYETLFRLLPPAKKILDVGCGYGGSAILLSSLGYEVTAIDIDESMVKKTIINASLLGRVAPKQIKCELGDTFDLSRYYGQFDVAFSAGVMEHFEPKRAVQGLHEQAKTAKYVIVAVPTKYLDEPFHGYKYPHTLRSLKSICREAGILPFKNLAFGDPPQRALITLKRLSPHMLWLALFGKIFSTSVACFCKVQPSESLLRDT